MSDMPQTVVQRRPWGAAVAGFAFAAYGLVAGRPPFLFAAALAAAIYPVVRFAGMTDELLLVKPDIAVHAIPVIVCWLLIWPLWKASGA